MSGLFAYCNGAGVGLIDLLFKAQPHIPRVNRRNARCFMCAVHRWLMASNSPSPGGTWMDSWRGDAKVRKWASWLRSLHAQEGIILRAPTIQAREEGTLQPHSGVWPRDFGRRAVQPRGSHLRIVSSKRREQGTTKPNSGGIGPSGRGLYRGIQRSRVDLNCEGFTSLQGLHEGFSVLNLDLTTVTTSSAPDNNSDFDDLWNKPQREVV